MATVTTQLLTAEEFARLPNPADGSRQELVNGVVVAMPPPAFRHGKLQFRIAKILDKHVEPNRLGQVITETGVRTTRGPDSVRGPDVTFWTVERVPPDSNPDVYPDVAADLCVEVLSPNDTQKAMRVKVEEYLRSGVRVVWVVDDDRRTVTVYRSADRGTVLHEEAELQGEDVLPGFSCKVSDLFP